MRIYQVLFAALALPTLYRVEVEPLESAAVVYMGPGSGALDHGQATHVVLIRCPPACRRLFTLKEGAAVQTGRLSPSVVRENGMHRDACGAPEANLSKQNWLLRMRSPEYRRCKEN
jgi:hypothetical protein